MQVFIAMYAFAHVFFDFRFVFGCAGVIYNTVVSLLIRRIRIFSYLKIRLWLNFLRINQTNL